MFLVIVQFRQKFTTREMQRNCTGAPKSVVHGFLLDFFGDTRIKYSEGQNYAINSLFGE